MLLSKRLKNPIEIEKQNIRWWYKKMMLKKEEKKNKANPGEPSNPGLIPQTHNLLALDPGSIKKLNRWQI